MRTLRFSSDPQCDVNPRSIRFSELYASGFLNGGSYDAIPPEVSAYTLEGSFEANPASHFSVADEVRKWAAEGRFQGGINVVRDGRTLPSEHVIDYGALWSAARAESGAREAKRGRKAAGIEALQTAVRTTGAACRFPPDLEDEN